MWKKGEKRKKGLSLNVARLLVIQKLLIYWIFRVYGKL